MKTERTGVLGKKIGMTQVFTEGGRRVPVTVIHAGGCKVLGKKTVEKDGYSAVQLGYDEKPMRVCSKAELGKAEKAKVPVMRHIQELRLSGEGLSAYEVGSTVSLSSLFSAGTYLDVKGVSKGKGYQGVMKRHHLGGSRNTHGTHEFFRHGGSIGCRLTPGRVHKGKRMSGHMGQDNCTVQSLALVKVLEEEGLLLVRGAVPGGKNGEVMVCNAVKRTGVAHLEEVAQEGKAKKGAPAKKPAPKKK